MAFSRHKIAQSGVQTPVFVKLLRLYRTEGEVLYLKTLLVANVMQLQQ